MTTVAKADVATRFRPQAELKDLRQRLLSELIALIPVLSSIWFLYLLLSHGHIVPEQIPAVVCGVSVFFVYKLHERRPACASWVLVLAFVLAEALAVSTWPALITAAFGVLGILIANALLGNWPALVITFGMWGVVSWTWSHLPSALPVPSANPELLALYILSWGTAWLVTRPLHTAVAWALAAWSQATAALEETRTRRAELYRALRALEEATYRIERMNNDLVVAHREAEEARALKARFASTVSHELRGPLNLILGFSQMIACSPERYQAPLPEAYREDVQTIYQSSQHLVALVDDILDLSQIEAERLPLVKDRVDLEQDVIRKVADIVQPLAQRKNLSFRLDLAGNLPWLIVDPVRLRQALLNVLMNALRFTDKGGIVVRSKLAEGIAIVSVQDTGPGIAPHEMSRLFQEFSQLESGRAREAGGSGLGLSITKHLVELHGGQIRVESTPGYGTTMHLCLPLPGTESALANMEQTETRMPFLSKDICLIVHDNPAIVRLLARYLESYHVVGLPDSQEVLGLTTRLHPRAIIGSPESIQEIQTALTASPFDVPVIACAMPHFSAWGRNSGISSYLIKPISAEMVLAVMHRLERKGETTVLLVDDEPEAVRLLERMLTSLPRPYRILKAYSGVQALKIMVEETPDIVFMDLCMPEMGGEEAIARMRADERLAAIPVVVISARDWAEEEVTLGTPISVQSNRPIPVARAARCLDAMLDALSPDYLGGPTRSPKPLSASSQ